MATTKPLRLSAQKFTEKSANISYSTSLAQVLVDTAVLHLDQPYSYLVPEEVSDEVVVGVRVLVPFNSRTLEGIVVKRTTYKNEVNLKAISSVISPVPLLTETTLALIQSVAKRFAAHPYDVISAAIPPRVASAERDLNFSEEDIKRSKNKARRVYYQFSPGEDEFHSLAAMAVKANQNGGVILLVPNEREVDLLVDAFSRNYPDTKYVRLDSSLQRSVRYKNYLLVASGEIGLVIGTRSAVFAPVRKLQTIFLHRDVSESYYEPRSAGWNARDVAAMRSIQEETSLVISGYSPSSEVARLIETKWLVTSSKKMKVSALSFAQQTGELLPNRIFAEIREALRNGPVLFLAPRKGYASALLCSKCRNEALCECKGKLIKKSGRSAPECSHCAKQYSPWKCQWCENDRPLLIGRGSERFAEELGRAFPNLPVISSEGEHIHKSVPARPSLVIATPGSVPTVESGYAAVVILEGNRFFAQADMRSHERAREQIFHAASRVSSKGKVLLVVDSAHPITASISRWSPSILSMRELEERRDANFPPYFRAISIEVGAKEATLLANGFKKALLDLRLPASTKILGPALDGKAGAKIILLSSLRDGGALVDFLHEFARKRSIAKKDSIRLRVDPYSLN